MSNQKQKKPVINPFETIDKNTPPKVETSVPSTPIFKEVPKVGNNATKLDFDQLNQSYANQDATSIKEIQENLDPQSMGRTYKEQFFKKYRREEEEYYLKRKKEEEEKKRQEELEEQEKKRKEQEEQARLHAQSAEPKGKIRKNIFGKAKQIANTVLPSEIKPGGGKQ